MEGGGVRTTTFDPKVTKRERRKEQDAGSSEDQDDVEECRHPSVDQWTL